MNETDIYQGPVRTSTAKVHGPAEFEGMRKAGRLAAECLDISLSTADRG